MATSVVFNSVDIADVVSGVRVTDIIRPARPAYTRHKVALPGVAGAYDFGGGVASDYEIQVFVVLTADSAADMRELVEDLHDWADGKHELYFTDDSSTKYQAQVFEEISLSGPPTGRFLRGIITFECDAE